MEKSCRTIDTLQVKASPSFFLSRQIQHLMLVIVLLAGGWALATPSLDGSTYLGLTDYQWLFTCLLVPVLQQFLVWFVFRSQLCFQLFTRLFGRADLIVWGLLFLPLLVARPLFVIALAISDQGTLTIPIVLTWALGILLLLPAFYTLWSLGKYFGFVRALGGDHFRERYRRMPFVRRGAFRWSSNAMYDFAFLGLWSIALFGRSRAALAVALFQHAYIWVHMYCTEEPDMQFLYGTEK